MKQSPPDKAPASTAPDAPTQKSAKARRRRSPIFDFFLGFFGFCLAAFSSYLPFYVYIHSSEFGPPEMQFTGRQDADESPPELQVPTQRRPLFRNIKQAKNADADVDAVVTGSINRDDDFGPDLRSTLEPAPLSDGTASTRNPPSLNAAEHKSLTLVFATSSRALVRDGDDLLPVAVGSRLPDGSTVKSLTREADGWHLMTSKNSVLKLVF